MVLLSFFLEFAKDTIINRLFSAVSTVIQVGIQRMQKRAYQMGSLTLSVVQSYNIVQNLQRENA